MSSISKALANAVCVGGGGELGVTVSSGYTWTF
jgi:hypothetical protein